MIKIISTGKAGETRIIDLTNGKDISAHVQRIEIIIDPEQYASAPLVKLHLTDIPLEVISELIETSPHVKSFDFADPVANCKVGGCIINPHAFKNKKEK